MSVTIDDIRINESDYFHSLEFSSIPSTYILKHEDIADPGRIALKSGYRHNLWPIILKYNNIVDPMEELVVGLTLQIPAREDINRLKEL